MTKKQEANKGWRLCSVVVLLLALTAFVGQSPVFASDPPRSCADILDGYPGAPDGEYTIYPNNQIIPVYCHDMASGNPAEYLSLVNTGPGINYSQYTAGGAVPGTDVVTHYAKIRFDPATLIVDIGNRTFASSTGQVHHGGKPVTWMPYGTAEGCNWGPHGRGNIDLRGTPFRVHDEFYRWGWAEGGGSVSDLDGPVPLDTTTAPPVYRVSSQVVDLTGGGYCGGTSLFRNPTPETGKGGKLRLGYVGLIDFESFPVGTPEPITTQGATFSTSWGGFQVVRMGYTQYPGIYEGNSFGFGITAISIVFDAPVQEFGMGIFDPNFCCDNIARIYDQDDNLLDETSPSLGSPGGVHSASVGFVRAQPDIKRVEYQMSAGDPQGIDMVRFFLPPDTDQDGDGLHEDWDPCPFDPTNDADSDRVCGGVDNCPETANPDQTDSDGDGAGDACDACPNYPANDEDGDGVCGDVDNCAVIPNPDQMDHDSDGAGDACDEDDDSDGVPDTQDADPFNPYVCQDIDNDACDDCASGINDPANDGPDSDGDLACDAGDPCPLDAANDADGDGVCGDVDVCPGHDDNIDADADGIPEGCDICPDDAANDADGDGVCGDADQCPGHDDNADADGDGTADGCDACPNDAANDADGDGVCGDADQCPGHDDNADADGDGTADGCDACPNDAENDADGDGVCGDVDQCPGHDDNADADGDGTADGCDACPNDAAN
ncbi:MAG: thrombospondin type 3 repeat-containing protein, partial [Elusimicrobiota bacterium]